MRQILKVASVVSMALWISACGAEKEQAQGQQTAPAMEVGIIPVKSVTQELTTILPGRSKAYQEAEVRPQVSGIILKLSFNEGGYVKQGQSLYQIDPATYKATVRSAEADLANAKASLASTTATYQRYQKLLKTDFVSKEDFDTAEAAYKQSKAAVLVAEAALNTAKINLDYTEVRAPISGRVGKSTVTPGALVTANQTTALATIQQLDPIKVDIVQSSTQMLQLKASLKAGKLKATDNAAVKLMLEDGSEYNHEGTLKFSEVSVDEATGSVTMRAEFPNPEGLLLPGMYVRAMLNTGIDPEAILVPQKAISRNTKGQAVAMVVNPQNQVEPRIVTTAEVIGNQWRITSGLKAGDKLIVEGLQKIRPGAPVTPKEISNQQ
ncbi:efflux RND transporter periplasmic adaptor subunit [Shewanella dokdonensis]|uniref:Efflux RND transporter periplasmic adaptor subunit n=1 Tax=Shewanella dokdonensis TaxID=712036 RepID=A0ABX8DKL7_9GAMM|nr:efflux RND transporter periplasmic adaptor subunit [Shewanella dokdonensis]MCL1076149.1 efflux RND transporter periplasmic adaptor subunit [Shewanella dokdonensis]QVK24462.1 efflux RND transporter periplasmic adaptor subunit [Shewanella dokdonensis]